VIRLVSNGRYRPELQSMVGSIANAIYLRLEIRPSDRLADVIEQVAREFHTASGHQDFGFVPGFDPGCKSELSFAWLPMTGDRWSGPTRRSGDCGVRIQPYPAMLGRRIPFWLTFEDTTDGVVGTAMYRPSDYKLATLEWLRRSFRLLAEQCVESPIERIARIPM
jgi:hypothetical protein